MYSLQLSWVPANQQLLPPPWPLFVDPFLMQQLLQSPANAMPWCFYSLPFCPVPVYQEIAQQNQDQYRTPKNSGPSRKQHKKRFHKAEPLHPYQHIHESSRTIRKDRSTGTNLGHAGIGASNNTRVGKVWRTPSKNPIMIDRNLI
jgi:hypothetical protein